jgi:hypothetical protein
VHCGCHAPGRSVAAELLQRFVVSLSSTFAFLGELVTPLSFATRLSTSATFLCVAACIVGAQTPSTQAQQIAPPAADSLRAISRRGLLLAQYDFVASVASDSLVARGITPGPRDTYVVQPTSDTTWQAVFGELSAAEDTFRIKVIARQRATNPAQFDLERYASLRADTGYVLRAARAIAAATRDFGAQSRPYNSAVIERTNGDLFVYLLPAQTRAGVFPLGGDVRYEFASDGRRLIAKRRLHNTIIEFTGRKLDGSTLVAGMHSAVVDNIPEDTDVFHVLVRQPQIPEYVVSDEFVYRILPTGYIQLEGRSRDILKPR